MSAFDVNFLTGNGYDMPKAVSISNLTEAPYLYATYWGDPKEISVRRTPLEVTYGVVSSPLVYEAVQYSSHRDVNVLMLYPLELVAVEYEVRRWDDTK